MSTTPFCYSSYPSKSKKYQTGDMVPHPFRQSRSMRLHRLRGRGYERGEHPRVGTGTPVRTPKRMRVMAEYTAILNRVCASMGRGNTSSAQLKAKMDSLGLVPNEVGTHEDFDARMAKLRAGRSDVPFYGIYNTMDKPPGQHWFCCYGGYKYDPLGDDASNTPEQPVGSDDCGQRDIAYLLLCRRYRRPIVL